MICSKPYDTYLTILNSEKEDFEVRIKRNVLPGVIKIKDMILKEA